MTWTESITALLKTDTKAGLRQLFIMSSLHFVLLNVFIYITVNVAEFLSEYMITNTSDSFTFTLTGMAGWLAQQLRLPEAFAVTVSAVAVRFVRRVIMRS